MILYNRESKHRVNREVAKVLDDYYNDKGEYPKVLSVSSSKYEEREQIFEPVRYHSKMVFISDYGEISVEIDKNQLEPYKVL